MLDTIANLGARRAMEDFVDHCELKTPAETARLFREYTWLIWDYKLIGKIYDYYPDKLPLHTEHTETIADVETVAANTMAFTAAVPDNETVFLDIFAEGDQEHGYSFFQATHTIGTSTGWSACGRPTGSSLAEGGRAGIGTCECRVEKVDGKWKIVEEWLVRSTLAERAAMTPDDGEEAQPAETSKPKTKVDQKTPGDGEERGGTAMNADEKAAEIRRLCALTDHARLESREDVKTFVESLTKLVYDYKMTGKIYDFYSRNVEYHKQNKIKFKNIEEVVAQTAAFCAAFPDLETEIENIIVEQAAPDFFKVSRRMLFRGTNLGFSRFGAPTGRSLGDGCRNLTMMYLKKVDDEWKIALEISNDCEEWLRTVMNGSAL